MRTSRRLAAAALLLALTLAACGGEERPCVEHEECFGGEYCAQEGVCKPYDGRTRTSPRPDDDD